MVLNHILQQCVLDNEKQDVLWESNLGVTNGNMGEKSTVRKVLQEGHWWPKRFQDEKEYVEKYDVFQCVGRRSH